MILKLKKDENLVFQTGSYIKDFFGENSPEFIFISNFSFTVIYTTRDSTKAVLSELKDRKHKFKSFLENCIEALENKGIYKKQKASLLDGMSNIKIIGLLLSIIVPIATFSFWLGGVYQRLEDNKSGVFPSDNKNFANPTQQKKDTGNNNSPANNISDTNIHSVKDTMIISQSQK